ncbi:hypothetical protein [Dietzia maris]|uniref:hypothetical protein n=1 Tax=Dietzia maris TaxID=37915 RepID=UPI00142DBDF7
MNPSGSVFIGAHVKIAKSGQLSPRLHFHDDVDRGGMIHAGYIGRHSANSMPS